MHVRDAASSVEFLPLVGPTLSQSYRHTMRRGARLHRQVYWSNYTSPFHWETRRHLAFRAWIVRGKAAIDQYPGGGNMGGLCIMIAAASLQSVGIASAPSDLGRVVGQVACIRLDIVGVTTATEAVGSSSEPCVALKPCGTQDRDKAWSLPSWPSSAVHPRHWSSRPSSDRTASGHWDGCARRLHARTIDAPLDESGGSQRRVQPADALRPPDMSTAAGRRSLPGRRPHRMVRHAATSRELYRGRPSTSGLLDDTFLVTR